MLSAQTCELWLHFSSKARRPSLERVCSPQRAHALFKPSIHSVFNPQLSLSMGFRRGSKGCPRVFKGFPMVLKGFPKENPSKTLRKPLPTRWKPLEPHRKPLDNRWEPLENPSKIPGSHLKTENPSNTFGNPRKPRGSLWKTLGNIRLPFDKASESRTSIGIIATRAACHHGSTKRLTVDNIQRFHGISGLFHGMSHLLIACSLFKLQSGVI